MNSGVWRLGLLVLTLATAACGDSSAPAWQPCAADEYCVCEVFVWECFDEPKIDWSPSSACPVELPEVGESCDITSFEPCLYCLGGEFGYPVDSWVISLEDRWCDEDEGVVKGNSQFECLGG